MTRLNRAVESLERRQLFSVALLTGASENLGDTIGVDTADPVRDAVYVYDQSTNHILVIDTDTGQTAGVTTPAAAVAGLAVSPDDSTLYASEPGDSKVEVFSLPGMTSLRRLSVSAPVGQIVAGVNGLVVGVDGSTATAFSGSTGATQYALNFANGPRLRTDSAGTVVYARNTGNSPDDGGIYPNPLTSGGSSAYIPAPGGADLTDFVVNPASGYAFTGDGGVDNIEVTQISTDSHAVWPLQDGTGVTGLAMLAGGSSVYATTANGYITQSNMSGTETASYQPAGGVSGDSLVITPNGKLISTFATGVNIVGLSSLDVTQTPATPAASSTILTTSATSITAGGSVVLTTTVSPLGIAGPAPTGSVTVDVTGRAPQTFSLLSGDTQVATTSFLAGTYTVSEHYSGDSTYAGSDSIPVTIVATPATTPLVNTVTQLGGIAPNPVAAGTTVTFSGSVASSTGTGATPTGTVTLYSGATTLGSTTLQSDGSFTVSSRSLPAGIDAVIADYGGDLTYAASASAAASVTVLATVVSAGESVTTLSGVTPNPAAVGAMVTLRGSVASAAGGAIIPTGLVTLFDGGVSIGTAALLGDGTFTTITASLPAGTDALTATYGGDSVFAASTSVAIDEVVKPATVTPRFGSASLPATVVAGANFAGKLPLMIANPSSPIKGKFTVNVYADTTGVLDGTQALLETTTRTLALKTGQTKPLMLKLKSLPATLPSGTYYVLAEVIDPTGTSTVATLASTVQVAAPFVSLSAVVGPVLPSTLLPGKVASLIVTVTNTGNTPATGPVAVVLNASTGVRLGSTAHGVKINPGRSIKVKLHFKSDGMLSSGSYFPQAVVTLGDAMTTATGDVAFSV